MTPDLAYLPRYRERSLADLLPTLAARLGIGGYEPVLDIAPAAGYVVVLIDGFGWEQLRGHATQAPYLTSLMRARDPLTVGCPSTTATSLTTLGTGLTPGEHGIAGFRFRLPETGELLQPLVWDSSASPRSVQPAATVFEQGAAVGQRSALVVPQRLEGSGLTAAALRGADVFGLADELDDEARMDAVAAALAGGSSLVYCYYRELDHTGHGRGVDSPAWRARLTMVDAFCEDLRDRLDPETRIIVTGDHGMVDVPGTRRVTVEDVPALSAGVAAVGGEARFRQLYTAEPDTVAARWRDYWGDRAWILTRNEAEQAGWFGPVSDRVRPRFGDVVVAFRDNWAAMTTELPKEFGLVGMHGSLTSAEMLVPLLEA